MGPARAWKPRALIASLRERGRTVFLTTHNMAEAAEICDRVGFLIDGRIALEGAPAELMRRFGRPRLMGPPHQTMRSGSGSPAT
jgi:fluoroquinolone transport system ATP-binding protein